MSAKPDLWKVSVIRPEGWVWPQGEPYATWRMPGWVRELANSYSSRPLPEATRTKHFRAKAKAFRVVRLCDKIGFIVTIEPMQLVSCGPEQALVLPGRDPVVLPESVWP